MLILFENCRPEIYASLSDCHLHLAQGVLDLTLGDLQSTPITILFTRPLSSIFLTAPIGAHKQNELEQASTGLSFIPEERKRPNIATNQAWVIMYQALNS